MNCSIAHLYPTSGPCGNGGSSEQTEVRRANMNELLDLALQAHGQAREKQFAGS